MEVKTTQDFLNLNDSEKIEYIQLLNERIRKERTEKDKLKEEVAKLESSKESLNSVYSKTLKENIALYTKVKELETQLEPFIKWKKAVGNKKGQSLYKEKIVELANKGYYKAQIVKELGCSQPTVDKYFPTSGNRGKTGRRATL